MKNVLIRIATSLTVAGITMGMAHGAPKAKCNLTMDAYDQISDGMDKSAVKAIMGCKPSDNMKMNMGATTIETNSYMSSDYARMIMVSYTDGYVSMKVSSGID